MNLKRTLVVAVIFLLMGGFYYFYEIKGKPDRQNKEKLQTAIFTVKDENIKSFSFKRKDADFFFTRRDDLIWKMDKPAKAEADQNTLNNFVTALTSLKKERIVEEKPQGGIEKYGLKNPAYILTLSEAGKDETLLIGDQTVDGRYFYGKRADSDEVFVTDAGFKYNLDKSVAEYRNRSVITIPQDKIRKVVLKNADTTLTFEKNEFGWNLVSPKIPRPGKEEIGGFVSALISTAAKDFIPDNPGNRKKFGLENSKIRLEVYGEEPKPVVIYIGKSDKENKLLYARGENSPELYVLNIFDKDKFDVKPMDLIQHKLTEADASQVTLLTAEIAEKKYMFKKEESEDKFAERTGTKNQNFQWKMVSPVKASVDIRVMDMILGSAYLYVKRVKPIQGENLAVYGLDKPSMKITAQREDTRVLFEIIFGKESSEEGEKGFVYAKVKDENTVVLLNGDAVKKIKDDIVKISKNADK